MSTKAIGSGIAPERAVPCTRTGPLLRQNLPDGYRIPTRDRLLVSGPRIDDEIDAARVCHFTNTFRKTSPYVSIAREELLPRP